MSKTPFNVMRHNDWDRAPREPVSMIALGNAIFGAAAVSTSSLALLYATGVAATFAISSVTSWALSALAPKPAIGVGTQGLLTNARNAAAPHEYVYGEVRKGGVVTYIESTGDDNKTLHQIIVLAGHEVEEIGDIYLNDEVVTLDAGNVVNSGPFSGFIFIEKFLGDQIAPPASLLELSNQIDSNFVGNGLAYLYVRLEYNQDVFANGIPLFTAKVKGKKVFDPRTSTTAYSANAALCIRDYLVTDYGLADVGSTDDTVFSVAANVCDETVSKVGGGTEKRYEMNGVISSSLATGDILQSMMTSCAGTLFWGQGKWQLRAGYYTAPVKTLTLDDLRGPISLSTRTSRRDNFNIVRGKFNDAEQRYITSDYPEVYGNAFITEDNGLENALDLELPLTTSSAMAQRLAKLTLFRGREQMAFNADFSMEAFNVQVGDIIALTNPRYGWTDKEFEVLGWRFAANEDAGDLRVNLSLRETSEAAFDWDAEETTIVSNNTTLPSFQTVAAVTNLQLTATSVLNNDGISIPAIRATWDASPNAFVQYYEIQYKRLGGEEDYGSVASAHTDQDDWGSITVAFTEEEDYGLTNEPILSPDAEYVSSFGSSTAFLIQPVLNGYDYNVRVRAVNTLGVRSQFATSTLSSVGDTTPPNAPLSLSAVGNYKAITLSWINPADQDLDFIEVWRNNTNNLTSATRIGVIKGSNFTDPDLPNNTTRFYWVRAVDYSLNTSEFTSGVSATTLLIQPNDFSDAVNDLFQEAGAFGVEPVSTLPASGDFDGQLVLLLPEITVYRWDASTSAWSTDVFTASSVEAGTITYASFAAGIEPVGVVDTLPTVSGYDGPVVVVLTTDGKLYRLVDGAWTAAVNTDDIEGTIGENLFSDDLRPIERVGSLPSTGLTQGRVVLLTTDNKLYRYTGSAWTAAVPATDLTGQVVGTQISDNSITTTKISANAVTATQINAGSVTTDKLSASSVSADKIAANAVTATKIAADAVTAGKIAANAVDADAITANAITTGKIAAGAVNADQIAANAVVASKIFAGSVTADKIATDAVTANKILASSIIASKIATGAVTADKISVSELSAISADLGTIQVDSANIANAAVNALKISGNAVTVPAGGVLLDNSSSQLIVGGTIDGIGTETVPIFISAGVIGRDIDSFTTDFSTDGLTWTPLGTDSQNNTIGSVVYKSGDGPFFVRVVLIGGPPAGNPRRISILSQAIKR